MSFRYNKFKIMASPGSPFFACYQIVPIQEAVAHLVYSGEPCVSSHCFKCVPLQVLQHFRHARCSIVISIDKAGCFPLYPFQSGFIFLVMCQPRQCALMLSWQAFLLESQNACYQKSCKYFNSLQNQYSNYKQ